MPFGIGKSYLLSNILHGLFSRFTHEMSVISNQFSLINSEFMSLKVMNLLLKYILEYILKNISFTGCFRKLLQDIVA